MHDTYTYIFSYVFYVDIILNIYTYAYSYMINDPRAQAHAPRGGELWQLTTTFKLIPVT